jgi:transcription initiation factor TFIIB
MNKNDNDKTKKIRKCSKNNKLEMWNIFDEECLPKIKPLECIFRPEGNREYCEQCRSSLHFSDEGFLTCTNINCGIIYKDLIDFSPEWRFYGADDNQGGDPTRCGMPINPHLVESSFGCKVLNIGKSSYEMRKIRRYTEWQSMPYKEKTIYNDFQRITLMAHNGGIPKLIIDDAITYHKKMGEFKQNFRGDNKDGLIAASIYISCRINKYPRTAKELATIFHLDIASATNGCKNAQSIINILEKDMLYTEKTNLGQTKPESFIERYCSKLGFKTELIQLCKFIAIKIEKENLMPENTPHSIAAGIIYFISVKCDVNIHKKDVKLISEISEVTINKCFKKLCNLKEKVIPKVFIEKYNIT